MIRERLRAERKRLGYTQKEMAAILHIAPSYYQMLEACARDGAFEVWDKLEDLTGVHQRLLREIPCKEKTEG